MLSFLFRSLYVARQMCKQNNLQRLKLVRIPPIENPLTDMSAFAYVMENLSEIHLIIDPWYVDREDTVDVLGSDFPDRPGAHAYMQSFARSWLHHGSDKRKSLALRFGDYAGIYPRLDFGDLKQPRLVELELDRIAFKDMAFIDWITSHARTLRKLHMINCPIIVKITTRQEVDSDGYPISSQLLHHNTRQGYQSHLRWHQVFDRFRKELQLNDFNFAIFGVSVRSGKPWPPTSIIVWRYKVYKIGNIVVDAEAEDVHKAAEEKDLLALVRLLEEIGQH